jgi:hypothetical protein
MPPSSRMIGSIPVSEEVYLAGHFICPECGSTRFGSTQLPDGTLRRTCQGEEIACAFQWPASDDHKYFFVPLMLCPRGVSF